MNRIELAIVSRDIDTARAAAQASEGTLLCDDRDDASKLPFRALVSAVTDDIAGLLAAGDVGAYVVYRRTMKRRAVALEALGGVDAGAVALFPMVRRPELTHSQSDAHWRDRHAPLALKHHPAMSHYTQLSILQRIRGPEWDGFALCGFDSVEDLKERFFDSPEGRVVIENDVASFADTKNSPRPLIASETSYRLGTGSLSL